MSPYRLTSWTLLVVGGFALTGWFPAAPAKQPTKDDLPKKPASYSEVSNLKAAQGIAEMKKAKDAFTAFAKYYSDYISHPKVYTAPQEFVPPLTKSGDLIQTTDQLITDLNRHILVPLPGSQVGPNDADYIRELGIALDAALKEVIESPGERVVRVNAARLLTAACRSGAVVHYATVTGLIDNDKLPMPPEIKLHAFQAAANLLAAYDLNDYRTRKHSNKPEAVSKLVAALQKAVTTPSQILQVPAGTVLDKSHSDVLSYIRRQAIRALAQVRFADKLPGGPDLYPAFTLAQVAVSDPAISPAPSDTEVAEAVIGICNITPPLRQDEREPYSYAMVDAAATGIATFATRRQSNPQDKSVAWKGYSARLNDGLKLWKGLYDINFSPAQPAAANLAGTPAIVSDVAAEAERLILTPIEGTGAVNANGLRVWRDSTLRKAKPWTLTPFPAKPDKVLPKKD